TVAYVTLDDDYVSALACLRDTIPRFDFIVFTYKDTAPSKAQQTLASALFNGLDQHMSSVEYRTILKYRLMIPLFPFDAICTVCRKACLDSFREHAVHYKELPYFKYRHDMQSGFTVGQAALKAASCKVAKHEKSWIENQHVFIPFAFDTFGFLAPEAVELLRTELQRVMNSISYT
ncbi:hypothetical protein Tco_1190878, partial [Tanacetum coccineum]